MNTGTLNDAAMLSAGLLVVRVVIGLALAAHGSQKLLGWFGGYGLAGTGGFFETLGFRPGKLFAALVAMGASPASRRRATMLAILAFPAHAGMNRPVLVWFLAQRCVPRPRGDEPFYEGTQTVADPRSPPTRG